MKHTVLRCLVYLSIVTMQLCNAAQAALNSSENCSLTMGWEPWKPFQYINSNNTLVGFDIELISGIVADMGCDIEFKEVNWARGIVEVRAGKIDLLAHADYTSDRAQWAYFSDPYRDTSQVIYVKKGKSGQFPFRKLQDIIGSEFRLGIGRGVFNGEEFERLMKNPDFEKRTMYIPTDEMQQYQMLQTDRIDGYIRSATAIDSLREKLGERLNIEIHPLTVRTSRQHVMFSKHSVKRALVDKFNANLAKATSSGLVGQIEEIYLK